MEHPPALSDPFPGPVAMERLAPAFASPALASQPSVSAELDHYEIAVVLQAVYEWGGYRYGNPADAIAAAKRGVRSATRPAGV